MNVNNLVTFILPYIGIIDGEIGQIEFRMTNPTYTPETETIDIINFNKIRETLVTDLQFFLQTGFHTDFGQTTLQLSNKEQEIAMQFNVTDYNVIRLLNSIMNIGQMQEQVYEKLVSSLITTQIKILMQGKMKPINRKKIMEVQVLEDRTKSMKQILDIDELFRYFGIEQNNGSYRIGQISDIDRGYLGVINPVYTGLFMDIANFGTIRDLVLTNGNVHELLGSNWKFRYGELMYPYTYLELINFNQADYAIITVLNNALQIGQIQLNTYSSFLASLLAIQIKMLMKGEPPKKQKARTRKMGPVELDPTGGKKGRNIEEMRSHGVGSAIGQRGGDRYLQRYLEYKQLLNG